MKTMKSHTIFFNVSHLLFAPGTDFDFCKLLDQLFSIPQTSSFAFFKMENLAVFSRIYTATNA